MKQKLFSNPQHANTSQHADVSRHDTSSLVHADSESESLIQSYFAADRVLSPELPLREIRNYFLIINLYIALVRLQTLSDEDKSDSENTAHSFADFFQSSSYFLTMVIMSFCPDVMRSLYIEYAIKTQLHQEIMIEREVARAFGEHPPITYQPSALTKWAIGGRLLAVILSLGAAGLFYVQHPMMGSLSLAFASITYQAAIKFAQTAKETNMRRKQARTVAADNIYRLIASDKKGEFAIKIKPFLDNNKGDKINKTLARYLLDRLFGIYAKAYGYCLSLKCRIAVERGWSTFDSLTNAQDQLHLKELFYVAGYILGTEIPPQQSIYHDEHENKFCFKNTLQWIACSRIVQMLKLILTTSMKSDDYRDLFPQGNWHHHLSDLVKVFAIDITKILLVMGLSTYQEINADTETKSLDFIQSKAFLYLVAGVSFMPIILHLAYHHRNHAAIILNRTLLRDMAAQLSPDTPMPIANKIEYQNAEILMHLKHIFSAIAFLFIMRVIVLWDHEHHLHSIVCLGLSSYAMRFANLLAQESDRLFYTTEQVKWSIIKKIRKTLSNKEGVLTNLLQPYLEKNICLSVLNQTLAQFILVSLFGEDVYQDKSKILSSLHYHDRDKEALTILFKLAENRELPQSQSVNSQTWVLSSHVAQQFNQANAIMEAGMISQTTHNFCCFRLAI